MHIIQVTLSALLDVIPCIGVASITNEEEGGGAGTELSAMQRVYTCACNKNR